MNRIKGIQILAESISYPLHGSAGSIVYVYQPESMTIDFTDQTNQMIDVQRLAVVNDALKIAEDVLATLEFVGYKTHGLITQTHIERIKDILDRAGIPHKTVTGKPLP